MQDVNAALNIITEDKSEFDFVKDSHLNAEELIDLCDVQPLGNTLRTALSTVYNPEINGESPSEPALVTTDNNVQNSAARYVIPHYSPDTPPQPAPAPGFPCHNIPFNDNDVEISDIQDGYEYVSKQYPGSLTEGQVQDIESTAITLFSRFNSAIPVTSDCWVLIPTSTKITQGMRNTWPIRAKNGRHYVKMRILFDEGSNTCLVSHLVEQCGFTRFSNRDDYRIAGVDARGQGAEPTNLVILGNDGAFTKLPCAASNIDVPDKGLVDPTCVLQYIFKFILQNS